jgi:hypothetical protein
MSDYTLQPLPPATSKANAPERRPRAAGRVLVWVILGVLGLALATLLVLALRVAIPAFAGYRAADALLDDAAGGLDSIDPQVLESSLLQADAALDSVAANLRPLQPLVRSLALLPTWGSTLAAAPELLAVAQPLSDLAREMAPLTAGALAEGDTLAQATALANALAADPERLARMQASLQAASQALAKTPVESLHPAIAARLEPLLPLLERAPALLPAVEGLPTLLGMDAPHHYLLLVQNNHELRPTGGFITAVGRLTLDKGEITDLRFSDSYRVFRPEYRYPPAPPAVERFMQIPYLTFRDANWSPDLPTSAAVASTFYSADTGLPVDSVITIDLDAVQTLIDALGPIRLEGVDEPITGANIVDIMKELWARPPESEAALDEDVGKWWRQRKDFIPMLAQAVLDKARAGGDPIRLAAALLQVLDQRSLQLVVKQPAVAAVLSAEHWDGSVQPGPKGSDYLSLINTNMGYNKVNAAVETSLAYTVTPPVEPGGRAVAEVTATYTHPISATGAECDQTPRYGDSYDELIARCYFAHMRLYTQGGSTLIDVTGVPSDTVSSQRGEGGTQLFSGFLVLPTGESKTVTWRYELPASVVLAPEDYSLVVQRQAGSKPLPLSLAVGELRDNLLLTDGRLVWGAPEGALASDPESLPATTP